MGVIFSVDEEAKARYEAEFVHGDGTSSWSSSYAEWERRRGNRAGAILRHHEKRHAKLKAESDKIAAILHDDDFKHVSALRMKAALLRRELADVDVAVERFRWARKDEDESVAEQHAQNEHEDDEDSTLAQIASHHRSLADLYERLTMRRTESAQKRRDTL